MKYISMTEFRKNFDKIVNDAYNNNNPYIITRYGKAAVALISLRMCSIRSIADTTGNTIEIHINEE